MGLNRVRASQRNALFLNLSRLYTSVSGNGISASRCKFNGRLMFVGLFNEFCYTLCVCVCCRRKNISSLMFQDERLGFALGCLKMLAKAKTIFVFVALPPSKLKEALPDCKISLIAIDRRITSSVTLVLQFLRHQESR